MTNPVFRTVIFGAGQIGQMAARLLGSSCKLCALPIMIPGSMDNILEVFLSVLRMKLLHFFRI